MNLSEKRYNTIVDNVRSEHPHLSDEQAYELFKQKRYHNPENAEKRRQAASKAGKASQASPNAKQNFKDIEGLAKRAAAISREVRKR